MSTSGRERRIHRRIGREELHIPATVRIPNRPPVSIIDLSVGGALIDLPFQLRPESSVKVQVQSGSELLIVPFRPLRCYVASLTDGVRYQAAGAFEERLQLTALLAGDVPQTATSRLASALEAFLRQGGLGANRAPVFDHLLGWILDAVRRHEPAERISVEIRSRLARFIPSLTMKPAASAFLPDPSRGARFFGIDFTSPQALTSTDRRVLRATAQLLAIVEGDAPSPERRRVQGAWGRTPVTLVHTVADWQQMCRVEERLDIHP